MTLGMILIMLMIVKMVMNAQVQELEEKNIKKDSLIKKLAETVVKSQGISVHAVIDSLRYASVCILASFLSRYFCIVSIKQKCTEFRIHF